MEASDALVATIEASVALAGFSGIVVVLGRRTKGEQQTQQDLRLVNLLVSSFTAFLASLFAVLLLATELSASTTWLVCSLVWFIAVVFHSIWVLRRSNQLEDDDLRRTNPFFFWFASALTLSALLLQLFNVASLREFWPFYWGIVTNLALAARQFVVLLLSGRE